MTHTIIFYRIVVLQILAIGSIHSNNTKITSLNNLRGEKSRHSEPYGLMGQSCSPRRVESNEAMQ